MQSAKAILLSLWVSICAHPSELSRKAAHVAAGAGIGFVCAKMGHPRTGVALALGVAMAKEWSDGRNSREPYQSRRRDVLITTAPALVVAITWK